MSRDHDGRVRPLLHAGSRVLVDGGPICAECGRGVRPTGPGRWRHVGRRRRAGRSKWLSPGLEELRDCPTFEEFAARYPWAARPEAGARFATSEREWREAISRLTRYHARLRVLGRPRRLLPGANPYRELVEILRAPLVPGEPGAPGEPPGRGPPPAWICSQFAPYMSYFLRFSGSESTS